MMTNCYRIARGGRYRAIETQAWDYFAPLDSDGAKLLLYLWIGPHSTPYGILRVKDAYVLADLKWKAARLGKAWQVLEGADLVWRDGELVVIVPYLQSNPPANPNVIIGWRKQLAEFPNSPLFGKLFQKASVWLIDDGLAWLREKVPRPSPNRFETVPELRAQSPELRPQDSEIRDSPRHQGEGGVRGGEGGELPAAPLERQASPTDPHLSKAIQAAMKAARNAQALARGNGSSEA